MTTPVKSTPSYSQSNDIKTLLDNEKAEKREKVKAVSILALSVIAGLAIALAPVSLNHFLLHAGTGLTVGGSIVGGIGGLTAFSTIMSKAFGPRNIDHSGEGATGQASIDYDQNT
jgi:hypothetical protein